MNINWRKFRFWASRRFFEKFLGWTPAQARAQKILFDVSEYNARHSTEYCLHCRKPNTLIPKIAGSDGVFSFTTRIYECSICHSQQTENGKEYRYEHSEIRAAKIINDGCDSLGEYRYAFFPYGVFFGLISIAFYLFCAAVIITGFTLLMLSHFGIVEPVRLFL